MPRKTRKRFTAQEKVAIVRLHLLEHVPVSDLVGVRKIRARLSSGLEAPEWVTASFRCGRPSPLEPKPSPFSWGCGCQIPAWGAFETLTRIA